MTIAEQLKKEGFEKGFNEVREKCLQEGRYEERNEIACQMLAENLPLEMISRITGFSIKDLQKLKH